MEGRKIELRINRIIGQLKGIDRMIKQKRSCEEIILQLTAVKKAINGLTKEIIVSDVCEVVQDKRRRLDLQKALERVVDL